MSTCSVRCDLASRNVKQTMRRLISRRYIGCVTPVHTGTRHDVYLFNARKYCERRGHQRYLVSHPQQFTAQRCRTGLHAAQKHDQACKYIGERLGMLQIISRRKRRRRGNATEAVFCDQHANKRLREAVSYISIGVEVGRVRDI